MCHPAADSFPIHGRITGPVVMIGLGSIGKGTLPLIERHFEFDRSRFVVVDPSDKDRHLLDERGIRFVHAAVTRENYRSLLAPLLTAGGGQVHSLVLIMHSRCTAWETEVAPTGFETKLL